MNHNNKELITVPGSVIIVKVNDEDHGFFARVNEVTRDMLAKNRICWLVDFTPLIPYKEWKIINIRWKLNDEHIYGESFTMDGIFHRLAKVDFPTGIEEPEMPDKDKPKEEEKSHPHLKLVKK